jgi:hypothetical protein
MNKKTTEATMRALNSPVGRALMGRQWSDELTKAGIHAHMGGDAAALCQHAGVVFFVVLGAARQLDLAADMPELRVVRGAVNAVYDQRDVADIEDVHRLAIISGVEAAQRLASAMPQRVVVDSYWGLCLKLAQRSVTSDDFLRLMGRDGAATNAAGDGG